MIVRTRVEESVAGGSGAGGWVGRLTAGALGDRYGRRGAWQLGLVVFLAGFGGTPPSPTPPVR